MATSRVLALMAQEEKEHLVEPCEVEAPGKPWLGRLSRLGAFLVAGLVLLAIVPLPGGLHDWLEGLQDPNLRSLQIELQAAGLLLPFEQKSHISSEAGSVLCVVDVAQSVGRIMGIATSIKGATVNCDYKRIEREEKRPVTKDERQRCAVTIIGVLVNTALGIGAMSSSISTCAGSVNVPANCAANINAFIGNALVLVATAMAADLSCPEDPLPDRIEAKAKEIADAKEEAAREVNDWLKEHGQDYKVLPPSPAVPKDVVYTNIARCVGSLDLAVTFVMKSAVIIADSTVDCSEEELIDEDDKRVCAINIIGLMGTLSLATRFFALASNSCVAIVGDSTPRAACAADIAGINAGVYATVAPAMNLQASCEDAFDTWSPDEWPIHKELRQSATKQAPKKRQREAVNDFFDHFDHGFTVIADP